MYLGIDLGTSGVKVILLTEDGHVKASQSSPLSVSRPQALWSEQDPESWWQATDDAMIALSKEHSLENVKAIGLSGQMHGATLLGQDNQVLRPAILWNDGRSFEECHLLQKFCPEVQSITGNLVMPGFTAPKLLWVKNNEPDIFAQIKKVLLPKDYLRFCMTGDFATDVSDASGTLWLDMEQRGWSEHMLQATGLGIEHMPTVFEGSDITGELDKAVAKRWSMPIVPVVAGGGDNAAGAIGMGIIEEQQTMLSLGTSGVIFSVSEGFTANPAEALHSFGHAIPNTWHTMSVILSAASCLDWVTKLAQFESVEAALIAAENNQNSHSQVIFLPYLSGERTPHNDPNAKGVFWGMTHDTTAADLVSSVLEGVSFALLDGLDAVRSAQKISDTIDVIGGGARSHYWLQLLADVCNVPMAYREGGEIGPSLGAARLAALSVHGPSALKDICSKPKLVKMYHPNPQKTAEYLIKKERFQSLYQRVKGIQ
ncbi:xylulokinase [Marinomonas sp. 15G1-11]|uniref:Xylulose kinase n=1 Tax=Marinomonas phaeophyticola TaxID=3004091 RepID=A0ABT4JRC3_9GAMM|nr:xylulokinase [Marinomonas sp. 15G1-11]MCZ2720149.1 xylulokinase [Marinomonas sp. 15G1-11]